MRELGTTLGEAERGIVQKSVSGERLWEGGWIRKA